MSRLTAVLQKADSGTDMLLRVVKAALEHAREQHPQPYVDAHHMLGVLIEEIDELKREVFRKRIRPEQMQSELLQIAAVAVRGIEDVTLAGSSKFQVPKSKKSKAKLYELEAQK